MGTFVDYLGPSRIIKLAQDVSYNHVFNVSYNLVFNVSLLKSCVYPKNNRKWLNSLSKRSQDQTCISVSLLYPSWMGLGKEQESKSGYGANGDCSSRLGETPQFGFEWGK